MCDYSEDSKAYFYEQYEYLKQHAFFMDRALMFAMQGEEPFAGRLKEFRDEIQHAQLKLAVCYLIDRAIFNPAPIKRNSSELESVSEILRSAERYYYDVELPKVREGVKELADNYKNDYPRNQSKDKITDLMIEQARAYPIDRLIETKRNKARCINPDHDDQNPSMDVRKNFAYCYSCGFSADAIKIYMTIHGCDFVEAVKALNS